MRCLIIFAIAVVTATGATAQECTDIRDEAARLLCYDAQSGFIEWDLSRGNYDTTEVIDLVLSASSKTPVFCGFDEQYAQPAKIIVECIATPDEKQMFVSIYALCNWAFDLQLDPNEFGATEFLIEPGQLAFREFARSYGYSAGPPFFLDKERVEPIIDEMMGKDRMTIRFRPFDVEPALAEFNISGLEEAITPLREACSW